MRNYWVYSSILLVSLAQASDAQLERGKGAIEGMTGCYLVDYNYTETEALKAGYERDKRLYDVNDDKTVKEWIYAERIGETRIRLQHILFATSLEDGEVNPESLLKHQAEDWEYNAPYLYDFAGPSTWEVKKPGDGLWTRRITNLDDGLRYQCASTWSMDTNPAEWSCDNYAPIPGRESRDMGRKDYNTLERSTKVVAYGTSWLERQSNTKVIHDATGTRTPLAKELGKIWYVRLPDSECDVAKEFAEPRKAFWSLLRETWDEVFSGDRAFVEKLPAGAPPRFVAMGAIERKYYRKDLKEPALRATVKKEILTLIDQYRQGQE